MKYFSLIWAALWRKPLRTILTMLCIIVAFTLLGLATGVDAGLRAVRDGVRDDTLLVFSRFGPPMPYAYKQEIAQMPGVKMVTGVIGMGGPVNGDQKKGLFTQFAEDGAFEFFRFLDVTPAQIKELRATRTAIIVGKTAADDLGLKAGDRIMVSGPPKVDGTRDWPLDVLAVVDRNDGVPNSAFVTIGNYEYVNDERAGGKDMLQVMGVVVDDPAQSVKIARAIDEHFLNSPAPTRTQIEALSAEQTYEDKNLPEMMSAVVGAAVFMLLLMTGNSLMQSFRERIPELGTMKAIGFSDNQVLGMVMAESVIQSAVGAAIGLAIASALIPYGKTWIAGQGSQLMTFNWWVALVGFVAACLVALISAAIPAWRAGRMEIVNALAAR